MEVHGVFVCLGRTLRDELRPFGLCELILESSPVRQAELEYTVLADVAVDCRDKLTELVSRLTLGQCQVECGIDPVGPTKERKVWFVLCFIDVDPASSSS